MNFGLDKSSPRYAIPKDIFALRGREREGQLAAMKIISLPQDEKTAKHLFEECQHSSSPR